tara:strand:- start:437 stop:673 length:237 start_codon:yes stop_codon:yes gene_type:complete
MTKIKPGDLVTIKDLHVVDSYRMIEARVSPDGYHEMGIVVEITSILENKYAYVWWFAYDVEAKGSPSEIIPCQYLKVI